MGVELGTSNDRAKDVLTLLVGFGVFPLAWITWTNAARPNTVSALWGILAVTSFIWVPGGVLILVIWFRDNPLSAQSVLGRLGKRLEKSRGMTLTLMSITVASLFLVLLALSGGNAILTRTGLYDAQSNTFLTGLVVLIFGLMISFSWLGAKEDYSRTAYVPVGSSRGSLGPRPFPRASPGAHPTEVQREEGKLASTAADILGLSVALTGILLMIASAVLFS